MTPERTEAVVDLARTEPFRLGAAEVRPATREVVDAGGRPIVLEPRVMQVLVALARRRGEVVSRDELVEACWRGRVVGDDAINRCVAAIRRLALTWGQVAIATIARVGYRLDEAAQPAPREPNAGQTLVAVLPFETLSDEREMAYLSAGVCEEILQAMVERTGLKVVGRAASFRFRDAEKTIRNVAAELRATHVLDGSVRRSGPRVRVNAHLIECEGLTTLWSERFELELCDVFALQDAVAEAVVSRLRLALERGTAGGLSPASA
jgi:TolB-like protein